MKARLVQTDRMKFRAAMEGGPAIVLETPEKGRIVEGPTPFEAALLAAMGCTASDIVWILRKQREPFTGLEIEAEAERAPTEPRVLTKVHFRHTIYGKGVKEASVRRAIDLSTEKYCSVGIMLRRAGVEWTNSFTILPSK